MRGSRASEDHEAFIAREKMRQHENGTYTTQKRPIGQERKGGMSSGYSTDPKFNV